MLHIQGTGYQSTEAVLCKQIQTQIMTLKQCSIITIIVTSITSFQVQMKKLTGGWVLSLHSRCVMILKMLFKNRMVWRNIFMAGERRHLGIPGACCMVYALQKSLKDELDWLQQLDITVPLGVDEATEWCSSFVLLPKPNEKGRLCLDAARLNQALIKAVHTGLTANYILPKLGYAKYLAL